MCPRWRPFRKSVELWRGWDIVSEHANLILSISGEGDKYAREYYHNYPTGCLFAFSYPGVNTVLADQASAPTQRDKQIVLLTRADPQKGFDALGPLADWDLSGYSVVVYLGNGEIPARQAKAWRRRFTAVGMEFDVQPAIKGIDKFSVLKKSSLLYFPTRFEGFGIPPLEAAYCLLPCACSDLPVLREFGQRAFAYGDPESRDDMHRAVMEALESRDGMIAEHERLSNIAKMDEYGRRIETLFESIA